MNVKSIISGTVVLVMAYLLLVNYRGAVSIISQTGSSYSQAVRTLSREVAKCHLGMQKF